MSQEICIYGCTDGFIYIPATHSKEPCPTCHKTVNVLEQTEEEKQELKQSLIIPDDFDVTDYVEEYDVVNTPTIRKTYSPDSMNKVQNYLGDLLQRLYTSKTGSLHSVYLYTPQMDIKRFMYSYLVRGVEEGLTVSPLLSVNMLYTIQKCRDHDFEEYSKVYTGKKTRQSLNNRALQFYEGYVLMKDLGVDYYDILTSDILVLDATANTTNVSFTALADILAEREIRNKSTIVLGYWSTSQIDGDIGLKYILQPKDWIKPRKNKLIPIELVANKGYYDGNQDNRNQQNNNHNTQNNSIYQPLKPTNNRGFE